MAFPALSPFCRAMHFGAKRGIAIACRLSVRRPTVCNVGGLYDHIGWNSSKIISPLVCSLSADPNIRDLFQGEHPEILAQSDPPR